MEELIDNCQVAFVPGRLITDNIIMIHELVKGYGVPKGDIQSVQIPHQHFQMFLSASGLIVNPNKSCIYLEVWITCFSLLHQQIMDILGYANGELPFRYLGVPLSTKRKSSTIKSVLFAIQTFWAHIFILPKKIIDFIEAICRRFLWTGNVEPTKKALIAWDKLCAPKVAGGLNFINVELWNKAAICKLLWSICTRKEKLWIQWVHTYYIKGNTIWNTEPKNTSWAIQKIFKARSYFANAGFSEEDVQKMENALSNKYTKPCKENFQR
ncbi:PREDICTED: uncharacterized protein LOC109210430 [Nicotiana attenuata]|uniref:uncharacterized protein LOC109210430 n=1 Tax=Nicotiana attenuata TaxID=49451 RepID=UPI0009057471|nr:PREDICTED: uncharacterized protein LOC109210430 [Nicotiana attenuata]